MQGLADKFSIRIGKKNPLRRGEFSDIKQNPLHGRTGLLYFIAYVWFILLEGIFESAG